MFGKVFARDCNSIGEVDATKKKRFYRGSISFVLLATGISSGAPKVCTVFITPSRNPSGFPSSLVLSTGNCPTKSLSNASAIKAKPASMPVFHKINDSPGREVHETNTEKESLSVLEVVAVNFH